MTDSSFGLYLHIPFCSRKCPYCDFNTYAVSKLPEEDYVAALVEELSAFANSPSFSGRRIHSVFFGGGTPSMLSAASIGSLLMAADKLFGIQANAEVTLEANPAAAQEATYRDFRAAGVNRLSLGGQSLSSDILKYLGREHTPEQVVSAVAAAYDAGIENVSLDVIFGVPNQTIDHLQHDLTSVVNLPIKHISTYSLTIEKGTPFFQRQERGLLRMPTDDLVVEMMDVITSKLATHQFSRYEISNYAQDGYSSRHNTAYWDGESYLGIGAGAHSFVRRVGEEQTALRWSNCAVPADYMKRIGEGSAEAWREVLTPSMLQFEFFFLGLRKIAGVDRSRFSRLFGDAAMDQYSQVLDDLVSEGFLLFEDTHIRLTSRGLHVADSVIERFLLPSEKNI
jgi:oxygen-independent coproporphyrinogen-3 oxidase